MVCVFGAILGLPSKRLKAHKGARNSSLWRPGRASLAAVFWLLYQGRKDKRPWIWVNISNTAHNRSAKFEKFVRQFFDEELAIWRGDKKPGEDVYSDISNSITNYYCYRNNKNYNARLEARSYWNHGKNTSALISIAWFAAALLLPSPLYPQEEKEKNIFRRMSAFS